MSSYEPVVLQPRTPSPGVAASSPSANDKFQACSPVSGGSLSPGSAASISSDQIVSSMQEQDDILCIPKSPTNTAAGEVPIAPGVSHPGDPALADQGTVRRVVSSLSESQSAGNLTLQPSPAAAAAPTSPTLSSRTGGGGKAAPNRGRRHSTKAARAGSGDSKVPEARRQKRLERNRESARLSRRRRKQYLEVLEERVTQLSDEMDQGRRMHVAEAVRIVDYKRRDLLEQGPVSVNSLPALESGLSRTSQELMLTTTFQFQQLKSFSIPASTKFNLWLSLQDETYFRGGRAASERLSAARIGERMLQSGTDRVTPRQSMWPLLCNEVGLSYEQEERVRNVQRNILLDQPSWVHRHSAHASTKVIQAAHDSVQALAWRFGQREKTNHGVLTPEQRIKFLSWSARNRERVGKLVNGKVPNNPYKGDFETSKKQHLAVNLYILNNRLEMILKKVPRVAPLVSAALLKKLSRRPSFESLGFSLKEKDEDGPLGDKSFTSMGSLKRSASEMSLDGEEKPSVPAVTPHDAELAAASLVETVLGHLKEIMPPPPVPTIPNQIVASIAMPAPTPLSSMMTAQPYPTVVTSSTVAVSPQPMQTDVAMTPTPIAPYPEPPQQVPAPSHQVSAPQQVHPPSQQVPVQPAPAPPQQVTPQHVNAPQHVRKSSFLPPELNVVPEDMWPADATTDFLMELADDGWNIGQGVYMDTLP